MAPALFSTACLTNPRVRLGRGPVELNDWTPFRIFRHNSFALEALGGHLPFAKKSPRFCRKTANKRAGCE